MRPRFVLMAGMLPSLMACAASAPPPQTVEPAPEAEASCVAEAAQRYVGKRATKAIGDAIIAATGASIFQWVPPDTAVTMDYRPERVRISYDRAMTITSIRCG
ncbi:I78 family peptidase inhibitor [Parerythrobacter aestuarii]|uniref:I78 family peptidase inhibitor n=1 Tax=Parerythrobacter aestuarii TaxID=3020909 RepID=UPI0024DE369D|nr:I78 family peptidase inhibitor [Parerythrobacter aestuarii]